MREGLSSCLKEFLVDWKAGGGNELFLPLNSDYEKEMDKLLHDSSLPKELVRL